ncbi:flagellar biosynthesis protein FlhF [Desulfovibrio ferrophilus]|uniref:Putative Flagellar biosynthesis protein FlhF n=1 Tax=Desulfovibrio ferrophilus TaxID=241368 RepID=A0A2Z6AXP8_9BACT|nr:flagellar biosynthesis protein FlhF [Desulfovibrio ferrophilus]BBD07973.1 putative Flagellar biosynthesis protein FlhF [Desulfovibrio ferrophilus]
MQVKTFHGKDTKSALNLVKAELGPDAVILSSQKRSEAGRCWYEVTAALDGACGSEPMADSPDQDTGLAPGWGEWHREWDQIRSHMMTLMRPQMDFSNLAPRQRQPLEHLEREGVGAGAILSLLAGLKHDTDASILCPLSKQVPVKPFGPDEWSERVHAVAGPSGAGKTSALLRLAMLHHNHAPHSRILVIDAAGTQGQGGRYLKHYAELAGMSHKTVESSRQLVELLDDTRHFDSIFIDLPAATAAMNLDSHLKLLGLANRNDLAVHLVLSPLYAPAQLKEYFRRHKSPKTKSIVWTKLDEACNYGDIVNAAFATGLPASALSFGPGLRGTLVPSKAVMLWKLLFKKELPLSPVEEKRGRYAH